MASQLCKDCGAPFIEGECPARGGGYHRAGPWLGLPLVVGDLVSAGERGAVDYDEGTVREVLDTGEVYVRWKYARATYIEQPENLTRLSRTGEP